MSETLLVLIKARSSNWDETLQELHSELFKTKSYFLVADSYRGFILKVLDIGYSLWSPSFFLSFFPWSLLLVSMWFQPQGESQQGNVHIHTPTWKYIKRLQVLSPGYDRHGSWESQHDDGGQSSRPPREVTAAVPVCVCVIGGIAPRCPWRYMASWSLTVLHAHACAQHNNTVQHSSHSHHRSTWSMPRGNYCWYKD